MGDAVRGTRVLILCAVLVLPTVGAELRRTTELGPDAMLVHRLDGVPDGTTIRIAVRADAPVDVVVLPADRFEAFRQGELDDPGRGGALATRDHAAEVTLTGGDWVVVVDHTVVPPGGAPTGDAVAVEVVVERVGEPTGTDDPFEAATFGADHLRLGPGLGIAGATIWMAAVAAVVCPRRRRAAAWIGVATVLSLATSEATTAGVATRTAVPIAVGVVAAIDLGGVRAATGLGAAFAVPFAGVLVGADLVRGLGLAGGLPDGTVLVIGGGGLWDALVVAPLGAVLATAAWYLLVASDVDWSLPVLPRD